MELILVCTVNDTALDYDLSYLLLILFPKHLDQRLALDRYL